MKINLSTHKQGGYSTERFHLDKEQWIAATTVANRQQDGVCSAEQFNRLIRVDVPHSTTSPGIQGQWALNDHYYFECLSTDYWRRVPLSSW